MPQEVNILTNSSVKNMTSPRILVQSITVTVRNEMKKAVIRHGNYSWKKARMEADPPIWSRSSCAGLNVAWTKRRW